MKWSDIIKSKADGGLELGGRLKFKNWALQFWRFGKEKDALWCKGLPNMG